MIVLAQDALKLGRANERERANHALPRTGALELDRLLLKEDEGRILENLRKQVRGISIAGQAASERIDLVDMPLDGADLGDGRSWHRLNEEPTRLGDLATFDVD